jgi:CubicO group peptidase (beta-lactamase class C family)
MSDTLAAAVPAVTPGAQLIVRHKAGLSIERTLGWRDPERRAHPVTAHTRFDLASLTKLYTVTALMRLVEAGQVTLETPASAWVPTFSGPRPIQPYEDPLQPDAWIEVDHGPEVDAGAITLHQLLTHTAGLPAWRPLFREPTTDAARRMAVETFFSYRPGTRVVYSDIGLIVLGLALEALTGQTLDAAIRDLVLDPLDLHETGFMPSDPDRPPAPSALVDIAPTEWCAWRQRRLIGEVHDENAARLGGVSGHAGLFATARDVAAFGQSFLDASLLQPETRDVMIREQARTNTVRRGLGFALWSPDPEASSHPFGPRTFGHTGFTGTSLWIDPDRSLVVALLTNDVYYGRDRRGIAPLRVRVHEQVCGTVNGGQRTG